MIFNYQKQCANEELHHSHEWFFFRNRYCSGVHPPGMSDWDRANPSIGIAVSEEFWNNPVVHKHHLKLTQWRWPGHAPWGKYDQICKIQFTCTDDACNFEHEMYRWQYDRMVLGDAPKDYTWHQ